jgi:general secretion pathway protein H
MWRAGANSESGLTLLEVLVVMAILSLVGTAAALWLPGARDRARLVQAGIWLDGLLTDLRGQARREGRIRSVVFDLGAGRYRVSGGAWRDLPAGMVLSLEEAGHKGRPASTITFLPDGTGSAAVIALRAGSSASMRRIDLLTGSIGHAGP